eukprot:gene12817-17186_t
MSIQNGSVEHQNKNYGALAENLHDRGSERFYLTTAIAYTNGYPHIGHAYEFLTADIIVRYYRVFGYDTFFLTGSDEHGQKVAAAAEKANITPIEHCNIYVDAFQKLDERLLVKYSDFLRTSSPDHELNAQNLWKLCAEKGDIYLDSYEGWYNEREELFVSNLDAEAADFKDPGSGLPLKRVSEESYFFRMSGYTEQLISYIENNPTFIEPEQYRNNILARLKKEGLKDLSISRTSFNWGIPVPAGFDQRHVMYVWFDALSNYLSGVHGLEIDHELSKYWPASKHIIGKDIIWFHCVIWPCMLMSAGVPLPGGVFSHGFVNASDGRKMSKSYNNTIDPNEILDRYPVDSVRYYCCSSTTYGSDLNFSEESLIAMHNSELNDVLGNLVNRALKLCSMYCDSKIPSVEHDEQFGVPYDLAGLKASITQDLASCGINFALFKAMEAARATNRFLTEAEPWKMKGEHEIRRAKIVRTTLEAIFAFTHFLAPVIPLAAQSIFEKLNSQPKSTFNLKDDFYNLVPGTIITVGDILFQKIETVLPPATESTITSTTATNNKTKSTATVSLKYGDDLPHELEFTKIDIRVGEIIKIWPHPTSDRLYCEEIDIGDNVIQVASGLKQYYTIEELLHRKVAIVCNLKESKFQGFLSQGMVLAAKSIISEENPNQTIELIDLPLDAINGSRILCDGAVDIPPYNPNKIKKNKVWEVIIPKLLTNSDCIATWDNRPLLVTTSNSVLPCIVKSLASSQIS